jgi:hypothetical protein
VGRGCLGRSFGRFIRGSDSRGERLSPQIAQRITEDFIQRCLRRGPLGFAFAGRPKAAVSTLAGALYAALKNNAASGGNVSLSENGRPCVGISSAWMPPKLPTPLPAYSRASLLSISRQ